MSLTHTQGSTDLRLTLKNVNAETAWRCSKGSPGLDMKKWMFALAAYFATTVAFALAHLATAKLVIEVLHKPYSFYLMVLAIATTIVGPWIASIKTYEHFLWKEAQWRHLRFATARERLGPAQDYERRRRDRFFDRQMSRDRDEDSNYYSYHT